MGALDFKTNVVICLDASRNLVYTPIVAVLMWSVRQAMLKLQCTVSTPTAVESQHIDKLWSIIASVEGEL